MRRLLGIGQVRRLLAPQGERRPVPASPSALREDAQSSAAMVQAAAAFLPYRPTCLERSLVLWSSLRRRGIDGELVIGVRPGKGIKGIDAHAWVEHGGAVLNDNHDVREQYAAFPSTV